MTLLLLDWVPPPLCPPELSFCKPLIRSHHSLTCISHPACSGCGQVLGSSLHSGPGEPELSVFPASLTTALSRGKDTLRAVVSRASPAAGRRNHGCLHSWARRICELRLHQPFPPRLPRALGGEGRKRYQLEHLGLTSRICQWPETAGESGLQGSCYQPCLGDLRGSQVVKQSFSLAGTIPRAPFSWAEGRVSGGGVFLLCMSLLLP